jgi:hypothetical protein
MVCARCGHANPDAARFCSSCGAPLGAGVDDNTSTFALAVVAEELGEELEEYLQDLPEGLGLLVIRHEPDAGTSFRLEGEATTIGRHPDSDIFLDDITVSRRHVRIERKNNVYTLRDVGSLNGTYVNHERVDEARLRHGDDVQIGRYRLSFVQAPVGAEA